MLADRQHSQPRIGYLPQLGVTKALPLKITSRIQQLGPRILLDHLHQPCPSTSRPNPLLRYPFCLTRTSTSHHPPPLSPRSSPPPPTLSYPFHLSSLPQKPRNKGKSSGSNSALILPPPLFRPKNLARHHNVGNPRAGRFATRVQTRSGSSTTKTREYMQKGPHPVPGEGRCVALCSVALPT